MDWLDLFIVLFLVAALVRGTEVGFVRQFFSSIGFFGGLFFGAWINSFILHDAFGTEVRALLSILFILIFAIGFMTLGEYAGVVLKSHVKKLAVTNRLDRVLGAALAVATLLIAVWLAAGVFRDAP